MFTVLLPCQIPTLVASLAVGVSPLRARVPFDPRIMLVEGHRHGEEVAQRCISVFSGAPGATGFSTPQQPQVTDSLTIIWARPRA